MDIPAWLQTIFDFMSDAGAWGITSWGAAAAFFLIGLWEHSRGRSVSAFWFICLTVPLFWVGGYFAWRKQYVANRNGPDIHLDWIPTKQYPRFDEVKLTNTGKETATQVTLERFSWPELHFPEPPAINVIQPGQTETREAQFVEERVKGRFIGGRLSAILRSDANSDREPLQVFVSFRDMNRTKFQRVFICEAGPGGEWGPLIKIRPGKLTISRS